MSRPSVKTVARACGVSPSTVCRALNAKGDVSRRTRDLVKRTAARLGYVPSAAATGLRGGHARAICCIMREGDNELLVDKLYHLRQGVRASGLQWRLHPVRNEQEKADALREAVAFRPAGLIVDRGLAPASLHLVRSNRVPTVIFDGECADLDAVVLDRGAGISEAVDYLLAKGRRQVVLLGARRGGTRERACVLAHARRGLDFPATRTVSVPFGRDLYAYGHAQTRILLSRATTRPDALIAVNDACAIGALRALREAGLRVPGEVSVVGFDNIMVSAYSNPALSTVAQPVREMARAVISLLRERMDSFATPVRRVELKTTFLARSSA